MDVRNSERIICDVIMDQTILPGVGNIIKNEALFDAGKGYFYKILLIFIIHVICLCSINSKQNIYLQF